MNKASGVITLDGPAGVGKSTLARLLAHRLSIAYLDTGAMFRCLALKLGPGVENLDEEELRRRCDGFSFSLDGAGSAARLCCNGAPIGEEIRGEKVGLLAARIAVLPVVREALKKAQRRIGALSPLVAEGRDMGLVVFPDAKCKFFLDAAPEIRARRRMRDLEQAGQASNLAALTEQIRRRDDMDRNRATAPLKPADDAMLVDTSDMGIEEVLELLLGCILGADHG
ncbi:MAG: (d)CMP kinase [Desulfovibrio sp.]|jgi:cytidylate kinase|nr:(d)CMP kinase [Desulfovibrio sp.]